MFQKKIKKEPYDKVRLKPVIRSSICTGEKVAGFKDLESGNIPLDDAISKFNEAMVLAKSCNEKLDKANESVNKICSFSFGIILYLHHHL